MDLTLTVTSSLAGFTFLGICLFFILIFYQEIKEFKEKPLPKSVRKNDSEQRCSISMSPLSKLEQEKRKYSIPRKESEIILSPVNLAIDIIDESFNSRRAGVAGGSDHINLSHYCEYYSQGITNEGFNESEVI